MADTVKLTRNTISSSEAANRHVWPMKVTAVSSIADLESEIFVYHYAGDADAYDCDVFECVASVSQMYEIPKSKPVQIDEIEGVPYYRKSEMFLVFRNPEEADSTWAKIQEDVQDLIDNFRSLKNLDTTEEVELS